jgi:uncharacterized protein YqjF (DUF2071 family)
MARIFLTAEWRWLVMANYEIDPDLLRPHVPAGTELDDFGGRTFASVVGFLFLDTRVLGLRIPRHVDFEEVNLRFYVRREGPEGTRRGVVFIKEIVPRRAIAWAARAFYGEPYVALPMRHAITPPSPGQAGLARYDWRLPSGRWCKLEARFSGEPEPLAPGSDREFIAEHYWGYNRRPDGSTAEYRVDHPPWRAWVADSSSFDADLSALYGPAFAGPLSRPPASVFVAEGSPVSVLRHDLIRPGRGAPR